jgi:predicted transcriptional regulator of viral defense system
VRKRLTPSRQEEEVLDLVRQYGVIRSRDLAQYGFPRTTLSRLVEKGMLQRLSRGLYAEADADISEHQTLAEVAKRYPNAVVCLLSALLFHNLTTQLPRKVWLAVRNKSWAPRKGPVHFEIVWLTGKAFSEGVETHDVQGVPVKVYSPAKTVADCFKFRNRIGTDVAVEALRETLRERRATPAEIMRYAEICQVTTVIRPYIEALI